MAVKSRQALKYPRRQWVISGLDADLPAAGIDTRLYWATDTEILYRDTGLAWVETARGESVSRLVQLAEKAHGSLTGVTADLHHAQAHAAEHEPAGGDTMAVDAIAATGSLRTLGAGAQQAKAGNAAPAAHTLASHSTKAHAELTGVTSDLHHPQLHAATHQPGGGDAMAVDAIAATGSLRTLGAGAQQAMPGNAAPAPGAHEATHVKGGADDIDAALDARAVALVNQGDIPYHAAAANTLAALAPGVAGQALLSGGAGANPSWGANPQAATLVVAANDSLNKQRADYICNGVNDNVEIQAAIDALPATGGEVFLLDGTYNIEASLVLDSYQTLRGCGRNTILTTTTADLDIITATGGAGTEKVGILIADLCVDGNAGGAVNDIGILFTYVDYSKILNVWSRDNGERGIDLTNSDFNIISGNHCNNNTIHGIYINNSNHNSVLGNSCEGNGWGVGLSTAVHNTISGNTWEGNTNEGIRVYPGSDNNTISGNTSQGNTEEGILVYGESNTVSANICHGNKRGISLQGDYNIASNNTCNGNGEQGIRVYLALHCLIIGNSCLENSQTTDATYDNIYVGNVSEYNTITANTCRRGALGNKPRYGINIAAGCLNNIVQGNDLYDAGSTANFNNAGTSTIVQTDNRGATVAQILGADHTWYGSTAELTAGEILAIGDACYFKNDGKMWKADANAAATMPVFALATGTIAADAVGLFLLMGFMRDDTWTWVAAGFLYASATPGNPTQTAPAVSGDQVQVLGVAQTSDILYFNPSGELVEIT